MSQCKFTFQSNPNGNKIDVVIDLRRPDIEIVKKWTPEQRESLRKMMDNARAAFDAFEFALLHPDNTEELAEVEFTESGFPVVNYEHWWNSINLSIQPGLCLELIPAKTLTPEEVIRLNKWQNNQDENKIKAVELLNKLKAVYLLNKWTAGERFPNTEIREALLSVPHHPMTCCGTDSEGNRCTYEGEGVLIATETHWVCPCGKYIQQYK